MPPIRSSTSKRYTCVIILILSLSEIIPTYSRYIKKGLVYITIISPAGCQPLSCIKCTKANIYLSYNVYSISGTKYIFFFLSY